MGLLLLRLDSRLRGNDGRRDGHPQVISVSRFSLTEAELLRRHTLFQLVSQAEHVSLANPGSEFGAGPVVQNLLKRQDSVFRRNDGSSVEHPQVGAHETLPGNQNYHDLRGVFSLSQVVLRHSQRAIFTPIRVKASPARS